MASVNVDQLQKELAEAENFLHGGGEAAGKSSAFLQTLRTSSAFSAAGNYDTLKSIKHTQGDSSNVTHYPHPTQSKYDDELERRLLIDNLISQHNSNVCDSEQSYFKENNITQFSSVIPDSISFTVNENLAVLSGDEFLEGESEDTIFFASDLPISAPSLYPWSAQHSLGGWTNGMNNNEHPLNQRMGSHSAVHLDDAADELADTVRFVAPVVGQQDESDLYYKQYHYKDPKSVTEKAVGTHPQRADMRQSSDSGLHQEQGSAKVAEDSEPRSSSSSRHRKSRADLLSEAEAEFLNTCSFRPRLDGSNSHVLLRRSSRRSGRNSVTRSTSSSRARTAVTTPPVNLQKSPHRVGTTVFRVSRRVEELHSSQAVRHRALEEQRRDLAELEASQCTFRPQLSRGTERIATRRRRSSRGGQFEDSGASSTDEGGGDRVGANCAQHVSQRLFEEAEERCAQHQWLQQQIKDARMAQFSFQPRLNSHRCAAAMQVEGQLPLRERLAEVQHARKQRLRELRAAVDEAQCADLTFRPKIDNRSKRIADRKHLRLLSGAAEAQGVLGIEEDVASRLINAGRGMARHKQQLARDRERQLSESMVAPSVSKGTEAIAKRNSVVRASFAERQRIMEQKRIVKENERARALADQHNQWFHPATTDRSTAILARSRPELLHETPAERVERMACAAAEERERRRTALEAEVYGSIPFRPAIDPLSRALGRESSLAELSENHRGKQLRERAQRRAEERHVLDCSFHPRINEVSRLLLQSEESELSGRGGAELVHKGWAEDSLERQLLDATDRRAPGSVGRINMQEPERMARDIRLRLLEKDEQRRMQLLVREVEELRECTFQPVVARYLPETATAPVVVRGLGRHLELRALSARQKEEAQQRERDAFSVRNVDRFRRAEDGSTIVQSFRLHTAEMSQQQ